MATTAAKLLGKPKAKKEEEVLVEETPVEEAEVEETPVEEVVPVETPVAEVAKVAPKKTKKAPIDDLIVKTSHEMETISKEKALALAYELSESIEFHFFQLGGVLSSIQAHEYWKGAVTPEGVPYETFRSMMLGEYNINYRKGMYLIGIYNALVESGVAWEAVKDVGWTKLKELREVITKDNVLEWVERAKVMTTIQLIDYIKNLAPTAPGAVPGAAPDSAKDESAKISTLTVKLHADQRETVDAALEKAMKENKTEFTGVALDFICMAYLEGKSGKVKKAPAQKPMLDQIKDLGLESAFAIIGEAFPEYDITVTPVDAVGNPKVGE